LYYRITFKALWGLLWGEGIATVRNASLLRSQLHKHIEDLFPSNPSADKRRLPARWRGDACRKSSGWEKPGIDSPDAWL